MLIDDITIKIRAGNGGDGKVSFNKNMKSLGPVGGSGGDGGSVYFEGITDFSALSQFRNKKDWGAQNGGNGMGQFVDGPDGKDLLLKVPVGTVIHNIENESLEEIITPGQRICLAKGGKGGRGNFHFRGPTNTTPMQSEKGIDGEAYTLRLELKLIADVGLIGLPNVGKSSLLNELTNAKSKVANYRFTTLEPNLGAYYGLIIADIPGLIEGASSGKGLGIKFLRHIERTRILFHCIAADSTTPHEDYKTIRTEMGAYNKTLLDKPEYIVITRSDLVSADQLAKTKKSLRDLGNIIITVSIHDADSLKEVEKLLILVLQ
jgi:GTP-binding protein